MSRLRTPLAFLRDTGGASAAEFALILPIFLLFLLGTIDVGRFIWAVNENEKASQTGARWAVATDIIPGGNLGCGTTTTGSSSTGMKCYSYSIAGTVTQGLPVPEANFPTVTCATPSPAATNASTLSCTCSGCPFNTSVDAAGRAAFMRMAGRMNAVQPRIRPGNVVLTYSWSGLGYAGDPNGPDVAPMVTVAIRGLPFRPTSTLGLWQVGIPGGHYSLTMEDGDGAFAN